MVQPVAPKPPTATTQSTEVADAPADRSRFVALLVSVGRRLMGPSADVARAGERLGAPTVSGATRKLLDDTPAATSWRDVLPDPLRARIDAGRSVAIPVKLDAKRDQPERFAGATGEWLQTLHLTADGVEVDDGGERHRADVDAGGAFELWGREFTLQGRLVAGGLEIGGLWEHSRTERDMRMREETGLAPPGTIVPYAMIGPMWQAALPADVRRRLDRGETVSVPAPMSTTARFWSTANAAEGDKQQTLPCTLHLTSRGIDVELRGQRRPAIVLDDGRFALRVGDKSDARHDTLRLEGRIDPAGVALTSLERNAYDRGDGDGPFGELEWLAGDKPVVPFPPLP